MEIKKELGGDRGRSLHDDDEMKFWHVHGLQDIYLSIHPSVNHVLYNRGKNSVFITIHSFIVFVRSFRLKGSLKMAVRVARARTRFIYRKVPPGGVKKKS